MSDLTPERHAKIAKRIKRIIRRYCLAVDRRQHYSRRLANKYIYKLHALFNLRPQAVGNLMQAFELVGVDTTNECIESLMRYMYLTPRKYIQLPKRYSRHARKRVNTQLMILQHRPEEEIALWR
jgi:hypothetical protein